MTKESVRDLTVNELERVGGAARITLPPPGQIPPAPPIYVTVPFPSSGMGINGGGGIGHHAPLQQA